MEKLVNLGSSRPTTTSNTTDEPYYSSYYAAPHQGGSSTQTSSTKTMTSQQELSSYYATATAADRISPQNSPYYTPDHKSHYYSSQQPVQLRTYSSNFKSSDKVGSVVRNKGEEKQANYYYSHGGSSGDGLVGRSSSSSSLSYSQGQSGTSSWARDAEEISRKFYENSPLYVEPKQIERVVPRGMMRVNDEYMGSRSPMNRLPSPTPIQRERPARRIFFDDDFKFDRFGNILHFRFYI